MKLKNLALIAVTAAFSFLGVHSASAQQEVTGLINMPLADMEGKEANVVLFDIGPGWAIGSHYHPGHIFVYVLEGSINIEVDGKPKVVLAAGEVVYEIPGDMMVGSNFSSTEGAKFLVFQIGDIGVPLTIMEDS